MLVYPLWSYTGPVLTCAAGILGNRCKGRVNGAAQPQARCARCQMQARAFPFTAGLSCSQTTNHWLVSGVAKRFGRPGRQLLRADFLSARSYQAAKCCPALHYKEHGCATTSYPPIFCWPASARSSAMFFVETCCNRVSVILSLNLHGSWMSKTESAGESAGLLLEVMMLACMQGAHGCLGGRKRLLCQ